MMQSMDCRELDYLTRRSGRTPLRPLVHRKLMTERSDLKL
jgi:hypothetical protein